MALFDAFAIVDWSAANTPTTGKDSIWIALGEREDGAFRLIETVNPPTRSAAMARLRQFFRDALAADKRVFAGFDFPFGYPRGAAGAIAGADDWSALWSFFADSVQDTDSNTNNRFEIAGRLNRDRLAFAPMFWGRPEFQDIPGLPPRRPEPYPDALPERRLSEERARKAQPVWKMHYVGSVGSQAVTGMARLEQLRRDEEFAGKIAVWPFETGFADKLDAPITFAEIYPGLSQIEKGDKSCLDEAQVETLCEAFGRFDAEGRFEALLAAPADLQGEEKRAALMEEGWIVGLGYRLSDEVPSEHDNFGIAVPNRRLHYIREPSRIYEESFRLVREATDLSRFPEEAHDLVIRMVHACGMPEIAESLVVSEGAIAAGQAALEAGAPIITDAEMVSHGIIVSGLKQQNKIVCRLNDPRTRRIAEREATTRSAAQVDLWTDVMEGAIVAIGNAPTALFRLIERIEEGAPRPALILALPVGFVGAAESKAELLRDDRGVPFVTLPGRLGGSALAAAAVNALASGLGE